MQFEYRRSGADDKIHAFLDTSELEFNKDGKYDSLLMFNVSAYNKLCSKTVELDDGVAWNRTFGYVNRFLNTLSVEDKITFAKTYILIKKDIDDYQMAGDVYAITTLTKKIADRLYDLDIAIDLCPKLLEFVDNNVPIGYMEEAGNRPQDRPELTFNKPEVKVVVTVAILCKTLGPIYGSILNVLNKVVSDALRHLHCSSILTKVLTNRFGDVNEKLKYYFEHITEQNVKDDTSSAIVAGFDVASIANFSYCQLLVRQFVNVDLTINRSNLMSYIVVVIRKIYSQFQQKFNTKPTVGRTAIAAESDEEGNIAQLETDSMTSKRMADVDSLVSCSVLPTIQRVKNLYDIDNDEYDEYLRYYQVKTLHPSVINEQLNSLLYGKDFGGSVGVKLLHFNEYSMLTVLTQMILFQHDADPAYRKLAHLVTAKKAVAMTTAQDELNDNTIKLQVSSSVAYKKCKQRFMNSTVAIKSSEWENHMNSIIEDLTINHYVYNTDPKIWDWLQEDNLNGKLIKLDKNVLIAYCDFYNWIMSIYEEAARAIRY